LLQEQRVYFENKLAKTGHSWKKNMIYN
jgi:hypothetical protein